MDSAQIRGLCVDYSQAVTSCRRNRLGGKIAEYAAAKARRLDRAARAAGAVFRPGFVPERAAEYAFGSWGGGEICIFLPSEPDLCVGVPFEAFDPGYERKYAAAVAAGGKGCPG